MLSAGGGAAGDVGALDWINFGLGVLGVVLTIAGFVIAIYQINKTRSAAEAASAALADGTSRIRYNQLIILVPQLHNLESEMDASVRHGDEFACERVLVRWRQVATQVRGILAETSPDHDELVALIDAACTKAVEGKAKLARLGNKAIPSVTASVGSDLSVVNDKLGALLGSLGTDMSGGKSSA